MEKDVLVPVIEIMDFKYITVCIYRSPDSDFWIFLKKFGDGNSDSTF